MNLYETDAWSTADEPTRTTMEHDQSLADIEANPKVKAKYEQADDAGKEELASKVTAYRRKIYAPAAETEEVVVEDEAPVEETPTEPEEKVDAFVGGKDWTDEQRSAKKQLDATKPSIDLGFSKADVDRGRSDLELFQSWVKDTPEEYSFANRDQATGDSTDGHVNFSNGSPQRRDNINRILADQFPEGIGRDELLWMQRNPEFLEDKIGQFEVRSDDFKQWTKDGNALEGQAFDSIREKHQPEMDALDADIDLLTRAEAARNPSSAGVRIGMTHSLRPSKDVAEATEQFGSEEEQKAVLE